MITSEEVRTPRELIEADIEKHGHIPFAAFMEHSLYSPGGYYASGTANISTEGSLDFRTSPETSPLFGAVIARGIHDRWRTMGEPTDFQIIEMGAGNGTMAHDVMTKLEQSFPKLGERSTYHIVEKAAGMREKQEKTLSGLPVVWHDLSADAMDFSNVVGVFVSNELPDAFPIHRIKRYGKRLAAVCITQGEYGEFRETEQPLPAELSDEFYTAVLQECPDGQEMPACPTARRWQHALGMALEAGSVITIDYGSLKPADRPSNFLPRGYKGGERLDMRQILSEEPGTFDITTSVNFTALVEAGRQAGLRQTGFYPQAGLLDRFGIRDEMREADQLAIDTGEPFRYLGRRITSEALHDSYRQLILGFHGMYALIQEPAGR